MSFLSHLIKLNPFSKKVVGAEASPPPEPAEVESEEQGIITPKPKKTRPFNDKNWKLSEQDKQLVVSIFATGLTPSETSERVRLEHNIEVSAMQITKYSQAEKWQPLIRKIRQETMNDIAAVAGSHKKVRLERGERVYEKAMTRGKLDVALKATEQQRKEMEEVGSINLTLNQFNMLSDEELQLKHKEALEKIKRITEKKGITLVQPSNQTEATRS